MTWKISKRLDKVTINDAWASKFPLTRIHHLPKTGSDHNILLLQRAQDKATHIKYFKFLNFWTEQGGFVDVVKEVWDNEITGNVEITK